MRVAERKQIGTDTVTEEILVADFNEDGEVIGQHTETITREIPRMGIVYRDMTPEEVAELERQQAEAEEYERNRPMTADERMDALEDALVELAEILVGE